jgi:hypothetical protein
MFPAAEAVGPFTSVSVASYWIGLGFTWHFDQSMSRAPGRRPTT